MRRRSVRPFRLPVRTSRGDVRAKRRDVRVSRSLVRATREMVRAIRRRGRADPRQVRASRRSLRNRSRAADVLPASRCEPPDRSGRTALPRVRALPQTGAGQPSVSASEVVRGANGARICASVPDPGAQDPDACAGGPGARRRESFTGASHPVPRAGRSDRPVDRATPVVVSSGTMCGVVRHEVQDRPAPYVTSSGTRYRIVRHHVRSRPAPCAPRPASCAPRPASCAPRPARNTARRRARRAAGERSQLRA